MCSNTHDLVLDAGFWLRVTLATVWVQQQLQAQQTHHLSLRVIALMHGTQPVTEFYEFMLQELGIFHCFVGDYNLIMIIIRLGRTGWWYSLHPLAK